MDRTEDRGPAAPRRWTVLTWNVHGVARPDVGALAEVIGAEAPDVVLLQEVRRRQAHLLAGRLDATAHWAFKHVSVTRRLAPYVEGLAILSPHELGDPGRAVVSTRTAPCSYRRRIAQWASILTDDAALRVVNVHLSPHRLADERRAEARRTAALVADHAGGPPVVVGGDLNDADDPTVIALLPGIEPVRPGPTNPAEHPHQVLDHVLLPDGARDVTTTVPDGGPAWAALSDHLPVTCRFVLP